MYFLIDIDGTVTTLNIPHHLATCNEYLRIGIPAERLHGLSLKEFCTQPEVLVFQERDGHNKRRFETAMSLFKYSREALLHRLPIEGAREGVARLSDFGTIAYYTARHHELYSDSDERIKQAIESLNKDMFEASQEWLATNGFPDADRVVCCDGAEGKLTRIAELIEEEGQPTVYIDDRYDRLLEVFPELDQSTQAILVGAFTLGAIHCTEALVDTKFPVIPLPNWQHVEQFLIFVQHLQATERKLPLWPHGQSLQRAK